MLHGIGLFGAEGFETFNLAEVRRNNFHGDGQVGGCVAANGSLAAILGGFLVLSLMNPLKPSLVLLPV